MPKQRRPAVSSTAIRDGQANTGAKVEGTTVWYRGRSASFTPQEVEAGKGDAWLAKQQKQEKS